MCLYQNTQHVTSKLLSPDCLSNRPDSLEDKYHNICHANSQNITQYLNIWNI